MLEQGRGGAAYINPPEERRDRDGYTDTCAPHQADMQPVAAKLPVSHRTPFSVEDILDPTKFTRKTICTEDSAATGEILLQILQILLKCNFEVFVGDLILSI